MPESPEPDDVLAAFAAARARYGREGLAGTPKELLDGLSAAARFQDQATALMWRSIAATHASATQAQQEFIGAEVSLQARWSTSRADTETSVALAACVLPGLVESVEDGTLTHWHARRVLRELDAMPDLDPTQRQAIVLITLARYAGADPAALGKKVGQLIAQVDPAASANRKQAADSRRKVSCWPVEDGQSILQLRGGTEFIAAAMVHLRERAAMKVDGDDRTTDQRMFDTAIALITGQLTGHSSGHSSDPGSGEGRRSVTSPCEAGSPIGVDVHLGVVVPYSVTIGGNHELAEILGYGPILPSTARELAAQATLVHRIAVDQEGNVVAVDDPIPGPAAKPKPKPKSQSQPQPQSTSDGKGEGEDNGVGERRDESKQKPTSERAAPPNSPFEEWVNGPLADLVAAPIVMRDLSTDAYVVPRRLKRLLEARDRRCVFPTCLRPAAQTDKDHTIPWPRGATTDINLHCLCRQHHRAKQASFSLTRLPDGTMRWTTRGGQHHDRPPEAF